MDCGLHRDCDGPCYAAPEDGYSPVPFFSPRSTSLSWAGEAGVPVPPFRSVELTAPSLGSGRCLSVVRLRSYSLCGGRRWCDSTARS